MRDASRLEEMSMTASGGPGAIDWAWLVVVAITFIFGFVTIRTESLATELLPRVSGRWQLRLDARRSVFALFLFCILAELGGWVVTTYPRPTNGSSATLNPAGAMLAAMCVLAGMLVGFLFGIPRTLTDRGDADHGDESPRGQRQTTLGASLVIPYGQRVNTNLEQISDWLTKILVGVGLTQLGEIPGQLRAFGGYFAGALGGEPDTAERIAITSIPYFILCGFFFGYLWTRLFLSGAFRSAEYGSQVDPTNSDRDPLP